MKEIILQKATKYFTPSQFILKDFSFTFTNQKDYVIKGLNGTGKSTFLKIITGLLALEEGEIFYKINHQLVEKEKIYKSFAYASPSISFPEEFGVLQFLEWLHKIRPFYHPPQEILEKYGLQKMAFIKIKNLSSGLFQRLRLIQAFLMQSDFLVLDEPCMNFDLSGIDLYYQLLSDFKMDRIFILATNDSREFSFDHQSIELGNDSSMVNNYF